MRSRFILVLAVFALVAGACAEQTQEAAETPAPEVPAAPAAPTVAVAASDLGDILVDGDGLTLYVFLPDEQGTPTCVDDCVANWPLFEGDAEVGEGADAALLGTVEHPSGATQATYNDWPLYYFAADAAAGDVSGQGIGDNWYVVGPDGEPITE